MDKSKLKELALAATQGLYTFGSVYVSKPTGNGNYTYIARCPEGEEGTPQWEAKAAYLAAANPATILELLDEIERLSAPAADVGGLTDKLHDQRIEEIAREHDNESRNCFAFNHDGYRSIYTFARAIEREVLATRPSVDLSGLTDDKLRSLWLDIWPKQEDGSGTFLLYARALEREIINALLDTARPAVIHASDCAVHNEPAMPNGPCDCGAQPAAGQEEGPFGLALNTMHPDIYKAVFAFWDYWNENGETQKHGYYESTWGAINRAIRAVGVVPWTYGDTIPASPVPPVSAPAPQPTSDDQWIFDLAAEHEARGNGLYGPVTFNATGLVEFVGAVADHIARQAQAAPALGSAPQAERAAVPNKAQIIALANASGIDTDTDGDIWGSTNGAIFKFAEALLTALVAQEGEQSDLTAIDCPVCNGKGLACDECSGQGKIIVSRKELAAIAAPSSTDASAQAYEPKLTVRDGMWWPEGYCRDPDGKIIPPAGKHADFKFGYDIGYADGLVAHRDSVAAIENRVSEQLASAQAAPADAVRKAARWDFMMRVADNNQGPEAEAMEHFGNEPMEEDRPESEKMNELVDKAIASLRTPADDSQPGVGGAA